MSYVQIQGSMQYIERVSFLYSIFFTSLSISRCCSCRSYFWVLYSIGLHDGFCLFCLLLLLVSYYSNRQYRWRFYSVFLSAFWLFMLFVFSWEFGSCFFLILWRMVLKFNCTLNLQTTFSNTAIFIILILQTQHLGRPFLPSSVIFNIVLCCFGFYWEVFSLLGYLYS